MPGIVKAVELREKRARLFEEAKAILAAPAGENGALSDEQRATYDKINADIDKLKGDVDRIEAHEAREREMAASTGAVTREESRDAEKRIADEANAAYREAFDAYVRFGPEELAPEQRKMLRTGFVRDAESGVETRAQTVTTTAGGYLIPEGFSGQLERSMLEFGGVEEACDVISTETGNPLPWPTVNDTAQKGALLAINTQVANQDVTFGVVDFGAYKFSSKQVLVPVELLQDSAFDVNSLLASLLGERLARIHNDYETDGTGSSEPQGIVTGASSGLTAAAVSTVTWEELIQLIHSVDPAYRKAAFGAGFMFNDNTLLKLRQLKDGEGRPIWQPGVVAGEPDRLLGYRYVINQDMASAATGTKPILFGALKKFKVRKVKGFTLLRLVERYADYHQVGFLAFTRMDSRLLDAGTDPVKYITMA